MFLFFVVVYCSNDVLLKRHTSASVRSMFTLVTQSSFHGLLVGDITEPLERLPTNVGATCNVKLRNFNNHSFYSNDYTFGRRRRRPNAWYLFGNKGQAN
jgi:hypothetical protein